ncbi:MAG TPA: aminotransferase DegT, partial [Clostridiales bacterium]|nr:aminotransferase DegT [Clostridiales bacterium]
MVVSNDQELLDRVDFLSLQAKTDPLYFIHDEIGYNYRMTNIQAAFGTDQIDRLEDFIDIKIKNYNLYRDAIEDIEGLTLLPFREDTRANYWFYSVIVDRDIYGIDRDELLKKLNNRNIQTRPLWGLIHKQKPYHGNQTYKIEKALFYEENLINIPCSTNLSKDEVEIVINRLKEITMG